MRLLRAIARTPWFLVWFAGQMVQANWQVAADLLTPGSALTPGLVSYRAMARTPLEVTALSNLITLTPGTVTVDVRGPEGAPVLYVLDLYAPADPATFRRDLAELELRMLRVLRGTTAQEGRELLASVQVPRDREVGR